MTRPRATSTQQIMAGAVRGLVWTYVSFAGSKFLVFLATVILARLLAPAQFGQVAFALVVISYLETIGNLGIGAALIYEPKESERAANITFIISLLMGVLWMLLMGLASPLIAGFFRDPSAEPVLRAMACVFLIKAFGSTHETLLRRELAFGRRLIPDGVEAIVKGGSSIALALLGGGVWSLVWGQLLGAAAFTLALWLVIPWRPRWQVAADLARRMLGYGTQIVSVNILSAILHHVDLLVVGRMLGSAALGLYSLASRIPELVILMMIRVMGNVTFPAYARFQDDRPSLQRAFLATLRYLSLVTIPAGIGIAVLARPLVLTLYGTTWQPSIPVLQALAIAAALRSLSSHAGDIYKATGRPDILTKVGLVRAVILIPALILGARFGIAGVAIAQTLVTAASTVLSLFIAGRILSISWSAMMEEVKPAALSAGVMLVSLAGLLAVTSDWTHDIGLVIAIGVGVSVYALCAWRMNPSVVKQVRTIVATSFGLGSAPTTRARRYGRHDRYWIPLDHPHAVRFYTEHLFVPHSRQELLRGALARALPRIEPLALPIRNGHDGGSPPAALSSSSLMALIEQAAPRISRPIIGTVQPIILEDYRHSTREQSGLFLFDDDSRRPFALMKVAQTASQQIVLQREYEALTRLHTQLDPAMRATIPAPLALIHPPTNDSGGGASVDKLTVLLETVVPGRSMYRDLRNSWWPRRLVARHLQLGQDWLVRFQRSTLVSDGPANDASLQEQVVAPLETFQRQTPLSTHERRMVDQIMTAAQRLRGERLPVVARQGDFWARNLLMQHECVGVVDWERAQPCSVPFTDLLMFVTTYGLSFPWRLGCWAEPVEAFRATYLSPGWLSRFVGGALREYCQRVCVNPSWLEVFFPVFLAEQFVQAQQLKIDSDGHARESVWRHLIREYAIHGGSVCFG